MGELHRHGRRIRPLTAPAFARPPGVRLPGMPELFVDERGAALRVTWHAEPDLVVLSVWRGERCVGTVRLSPDEAGRLARFLDAVGARPPP